MVSVDYEGNNMALVKNEIAIMKMLSKNKHKNVIQVAEVLLTGLSP